MARGKKKESALTPEEKLAQALVPEGEQPYKVPENWNWIYLKAGCSDFIVPQRDKPKVFDGDIPWCRIEDIEGKYLNGTLSNQYVSEDTVSSMNLRVCPAGTVICSCSASLGRQAILTRNCCTNQTFIGLVCGPALNNEFLYYYLGTLDQHFEKIGTGTTIKYISRQKFEDLSLPLAPLVEQQRIVDRIEYLFAKLDEAIEKAQSVLDTFETRKAAILHKAFIGELTAKWRAEHAVEKSSWVEKKVGEFAEVKGGKRLPKGHVLITEKTDHPYLRIADFGENTIDQSDLHYITDETYAEISRYIITSEDVYLSIVGSIGKTGVIPKELDGANLTENAARIISQSTLPKYLCAYLSSPITQDDIQGRIRSATLGKLSLLNIKDISVPIPTKEEQAEIVRILDSLFAKEQQAKEAAEAVLEKIDLLKKSILARAFRGELGTNAPTEESALELLKEAIR